jgi:hypothetical protein
MKNKVLYIVGAIALLGGGVFLFLKNKKPKQEEVIDFGASLLTTPAQTASSFTTPEQVLELINTANQQTQLSNEPQRIVSQIKSLRLQSSFLVNPTPFDNLNSAYRKYSSSKMRISSEINQLLKKLNTLGYKEVNGVAVKLLYPPTIK